MTVIRCAIYTRKSSDEGLDQAFNSLDAQREAGEAYVKSQRSEGWRVVATRYDDGGCSGGTMERPALQRLLADVRAGQIDVVVVYKIDRLTRSLADFARIVELFDARGISFVSVTQSFNTTSSMGRLTLNVLLSFAQFEREVTGERIRDKIAASKARGLWMGGIPPLGYDLPDAGSRTLRVNPAEAATVRQIFGLYLELGSVHRLADALAQRGIVSKSHIARNGKVRGGVPFSSGALFHLLRNRLYLGQITHRDQVYPGSHEAIVDATLFEAVQIRLDGNRRERHAGGHDDERRTGPALFTGRIFDAAGEPMSPTFSHGRNHRLYRYYVSSSLQRGKRTGKTGTGKDQILRRIAAPAIETLVRTVLERLLPHDEERLERLQAVTIRPSAIDLQLPGHLLTLIRDHLGDHESIHPASTPGSCIVSFPIILPLRGGRAARHAGHPTGVVPDAALIQALRRAHAMVGRDRSGLPIITKAPVSPYERRILRLAFLAPDLQRDILAGRQPRHLRLEHLVQAEIPYHWDDQRRQLGWNA